MTETKVKRDGR